MSVRRVQAIAERLPYSLREQVVGYARAVADAADGIAEDAGVPASADLRDQLAMIAGLRKIYSVCSASFWAVDGAGALLQAQDIRAVHVGSTDYSRGSPFHYSLRSLLADFDGFLAEHRLTELVHAGSYAEVAQRLVHES